LKKRSKKLLNISASLFGIERAQIRKSLLVLFSKKNRLPATLELVQRGQQKAAIAVAPDGKPCNWYTPQPTRGSGF
jgi:hypothetical protein